MTRPSSQLPRAVSLVVGLCSLLVTADAQATPGSGSPAVAAAAAAAALTPASSPAAVAAAATSSPNATAAAGPAAAAPPADSYVLTDAASGVQCAAISCAFSFTVPYNTTNGTLSTYIFTPPCSNRTGLSVNGTCGSEQESMAINFALKQWLIRFDIVKVQNRFSIAGVYLSYVQDAALFPNAAEPGKAMTYNASGLDLFGTPYGSYYSCQANITHQLGHGYLMNTRHLEILAFTNSTSTTNMGKKMCDADKPVADNTVPIAVGAALAALVVIVVVAYFISRRTMRGYHNV